MAKPGQQVGGRERDLNLWRIETTSVMFRRLRLRSWLAESLHAGDVTLRRRVHCGVAERDVYGLGYSPSCLHSDGEMILRRAAISGPRFGADRQEHHREAIQQQ